MYKALVPIIRTVLYPFMRIKVAGKENIPKEGGYVLAANHISYWDPVAMALACPDELSFMAKKELFKNPAFAWLIRNLNAFPVDRGGTDSKPIKTALSIIKDGKVLLLFPEGTRMKEEEQTDDDAKSGMTMLAHRSKVPIVPAAIVGNYKIFKTVRVTFGKPVYLDEYYSEKLNSDTMHKISGDVLSEIRKIREETKKVLQKSKKCSKIEFGGLNNRR